MTTRKKHNADLPKSTFAEDNAQRDRNDALLLAALAGGRQSKAELQLATGLDSNTCRNRLNRLKQLGRVKCVPVAHRVYVWELLPQEEWIDAAWRRKSKAGAKTDTFLIDEMPEHVQRMFGMMHFTPGKPSYVVEEKNRTIEPAKRRYYASAGAAHLCALA